MASPFCQVQVSVNGGAYTSGLVAVPFGATVAMRNAVSSANGLRWELFDYPPATALPSGWQNINGVYTYFGPTPTPLVLAASSQNAWGMVPISLNVNNNPLQYLDDGSLNPSYNPQYVDTATVLDLLSPNLSMPGICAQLATQYDALRSWPGALMACLRLIDAGWSGGGGATGPWFVVTHTSNNGAVLTNTENNVLLDTSGGSCGAVFPTAPTDGLRYRFKDPVGTWQTTQPTMTGSAAQKVEQPAAPGTYTAAAGTVSLPASKGASVDYEWSSAYATWFLA